MFNRLRGKAKAASPTETALPQKSAVAKCGGFLPQAVFILGTYNHDGTPNLSAATSVSYAYGPPESLVVSLCGPSQTRSNINRTGAFTANICTAGMARLADYVGSVSGAHQKKDGIPYASEPAPGVDAPMLAESPYTMVCRLTHAHLVGETVILVAEIIRHMVDIKLGRPYDDSDEAWLDWLSESDAAAIDPLLYAWRYYTLGGKLGKLGEIARDLLE